MSKFKELVESLDREGLDELRRSITAEVSERRQQNAIQMEHIRPGMSEEQKDAAVKEIARVLREKNNAGSEAVLAGSAGTGTHVAGVRLADEPGGSEARHGGRADGRSGRDGRGATAAFAVAQDGDGGGNHGASGKRESGAEAERA